MKSHELKTDAECFDATARGVKIFEIRFDDRGFRVGDQLLLKETQHTGEEMREGAPLIYTGREQLRVIIYILHGPKYGLKEGWVVMSVA